MTDAAASNPKLTQTCALLYIVYAACALSVFAPFLSVIILGTAAMLIAVAVTYSAHSKAGEGLYETHLHWLIRTFWIGGFVYMPVLTILAVITVYTVIDWSQVEAAIKTAALEHTPGAPDDTAVVINTVMGDIQKKDGAKILLIVTAYVIPVIGWWLWRCWTGFRLLKAGKPVENVARWV